VINRLKEDYIRWIDGLKAIALVAVVLMHTLVMVVDMSDLQSTTWWVANLLDSAIRFCVPVFLMISGALLYGKSWNLKTYLKRRFLRLFYPFVFWTVIYIIYNYITGYIPLNLYTLKWVANKFLNGVDFHFWYIYLIIGIYLFVPVINKWIINGSKQEIQYFLGIWIVTLFMTLPFMVEFQSGVELVYFSGYLGYTVLGYFLYRYAKNYSPGLALFTYVAGVLITASTTFYTSKLNSAFTQSYYGYLTPNVALASVGIFMYFKSISFKTAFLNKLFLYLGHHSLGIYLVHVLILRQMLRIDIEWQDYNSFTGVIILTILNLLISSFLIFLLNRIPGGSKVSG
jgi:surface polysaccharide O-acyltransferase-like enzyme